MNETDRLLLFATTVASLWLAAIVWMHPTAFVPDDVFFYLNIADHIVRGHGSTFNGAVPTNGYHPLWMLVAVAERAIVGGKGEALLRVHLAVSLALNVLSVGAYLLLARRYLPSPAGLGAALIAAYITFNHLGSELHLALPLLILSLGLTARNLRRADAGTMWLCAQGAAMGLTLLGRLDSVFVLVVLGLATAVLPGAPRVLSWRRLLLVGGTATLTVAPYIVWNLVRFGHPVPISGAIKMGLARHGHSAMLGNQTIVLIVAVLCAAPLLLWRARARPDRWLGALWCGTAVHLAHVLSSMIAVWTWYFLGELLVAAVLADLAGSFILRRWALIRSGPWPLRVIAASLSVALITVALVRGTHRERDVPWFRTVTAWYNTHVPAKHGIAVAIAPGSQGYFSHHPILALDGLTMDRAFYQDAANRGVYAALRDRGVRYVMSPGPKAPRIAQLQAVTAELGHGGEGVGFHAGDDIATLAQLSVFSPFLGRSVGSLRTDASTLVADFGALGASSQLALYRLVDAEDPR